MAIATIDELFEWMEDFDNSDLLPDDRQAQLEEAVVEFNEKHLTAYNRKQSFHQYESWQRNRTDL